MTGEGIGRKRVYKGVRCLMLLSQTNRDWPLFEKDGYIHNRVTGYELKNGTVHEERNAGYVDLFSFHEGQVGIVEQNGGNRGTAVRDDRRAGRVYLELRSRHILPVR